MRDLIILPRNKDDFYSGLQYVENNFSKVFFTINLERIGDFLYGTNSIKVTDDSKFEIRYILRNFPIQKYGSFNCDFDNILFMIFLRNNDGSLRGAEFQTGSFTVILDNDSFEVMSNHYWDSKTYDAYIQDIIKRRDLEVSN